MKKEKLLYLITGLDVGGAERVVYDLSKELQKLDFTVFVVCISDKKKLFDVFISAGINTASLNVTNNPFTLFRGFFKLLKLIYKEDIRLVHAHMTHALIVAAILKITKPNIKIVYTSHSSNLGSAYRRFIIKLLKPIRSKDILFSEEMKSDVYKKSGSVIIPNGIDTSDYKMDLKKNEVFTYLAIGRLVPLKNHRLLIDAAIQLKDHFDFQIHIVGQGILLDELQNYALENKVDHLIKFLGYRSDINVLCNRSHVFLLPSLWEGLPVSMLEAGASSLPVISTPTGSIPDLVSIEEGYLADSSEFINSMKYVYYNYEEAKRKAIALNRKITEKYDLGNVVLAHKELYKSLI